MRKSSVLSVCLMMLLPLLCGSLKDTLMAQTLAWSLSEAMPEHTQFREMCLNAEALACLKELTEESGLSRGELLAAAYPFDSYSFRNRKGLSAGEYRTWKEYLLCENRPGYEKLRDAYAAIWDDLDCVPVCNAGVRYENSWMFERTYGGARGHEGCDLMPPTDISDYYEVVSMTDGVVEQVGWLPLGGWRIGIRSPSGGYFYYAHLSSYSRAFSVGERVTAGETLGMMGDTGYGEEGTSGKFAVHLHLGIYIRTEHTEELSVNPYWILRFLE